MFPSFINHGRRSGHSSAISKVATLDDLVVFPKRMLKDSFMSIAQKANYNILVASNIDSLRGQRKTYKYVFVDNASVYNQSGMYELMCRLKVLTKYHMIVLLG